MIFLYRLFPRMVNIHGHLCWRLFTNESRLVSLGKGIQSLILLTGVWVFLSQPAFAQKLASRSTTKQEALAAIPFDKLKESTQAVLREVVNNSTLHQTLPTTTIENDPDYYLFLIRNPEVVVNIWELMGASRFEIKKLADYRYEIKDSTGAKGKVQLIYGSPNLHLVYAEGYYEGPLFRRKIVGKSVFLLRSTYQKMADGTIQVVNKADAFVKVEGGGADFLVRALYPVFEKTSEHNFNQIIKFVERLHRTAQNNGTGMGQLARRLSNVAPTVQNQFATLSAMVHEKEILTAVTTREAEPALVELSTSELPEMLTSGEKRSASNKTLPSEKSTISTTRLETVRLDSATFPENGKVKTGESWKRLTETLKRELETERQQVRLLPPDQEEEDESVTFEGGTTKATLFRRGFLLRR